MCLDNTFAGRGCLQGPVALTHQPNCPLCSFSFKIVGDVGCYCEIVKSCVRCRGHGASHIFESHSLDSFQSFSVGFVLHVFEGGGGGGGGGPTLFLSVHPLILAKCSQNRQVHKIDRFLDAYY